MIRCIGLVRIAALLDRSRHGTRNVSRAIALCSRIPGSVGPSLVINLARRVVNVACRVIHWSDCEVHAHTGVSPLQGETSKAAATHSRVVPTGLP